MTRFANGIDVHIWGQKRTPDGRIGSLQWNVDKGTVKGLLTNVYNVLQSEFTAVNTTRVTLLLPAEPGEYRDANGNVCTEDVPHTGDMVVIDESKYYCDGDVHSWKVFARGKLHHYEIPLKAKPT